MIASIWGRTVDDYAAAAAPLKAVADRIVALEVNLSCPNVEARSDVFAHSADATHAAITRRRRRGRRRGRRCSRSCRRTSPTSSRSRAPRVDAGATGLTLVNTVMGLAIDADTRRRVLGAGGGGLTGPPIKPIALRAVCEVSRALPGVADHRDRRRAHRTRRGRDAARRRARGRRRHRDLPRPARAAAHRSTSSTRWCARHGVAPRPRPHRRIVATMTNCDDHVARSTTDVRDHLALALDVGDLDRCASMLARSLAPWFGVAKVGLELYSAAGPGRLRAPARPRLPRVRRPEAARHPDDGGARGARARPSRRRLPELPRRGRRRHAARRRRRARRRRTRRRARTRRSRSRVTVLTSDADASAFDARLDAAIDGGLRRRRVLDARSRAR